MVKDWLNDLYSSDTKPTQQSNPINQIGGVLKGLGLGGFVQNAKDFVSNSQAIKANDPMSMLKAVLNPPSPETVQQAPQNAAGALSYMVPELKLGGGILGALAGRGIQGAAMGGLGAYSQGQNPVQGAAIGAAANPVVSGAGAALTDLLPRYIGVRNFGAAGAKLPEVVKAENAAASQGVDSLKQARTDALSTIKPFQLNPTTPQTDRSAVIGKIADLANSPQWKGTNGLSDLVKNSRKAFSALQGAAPDVQHLIQNSSDLFDAYSQIKNYASSLGAYGDKQSDKLSSFLKSAAGVVREHLITTSDNPKTTRNAMDMYAAQTAIGKGNSIGGNKLTDMIANVAKGGGADAAILGLSTILPGLHGLTIPAMADLALTNAVTGPPIAKGLVNTGQAVGNSGVGNILRRLGIGGVQQATQYATQ